MFGFSVSLYLYWISIRFSLKTSLVQYLSSIFYKSLLLLFLSLLRDRPTPFLRCPLMFA